MSEVTMFSIGFICGLIAMFCAALHITEGGLK